jgi:hypothetical protein
MGMNGSSRGVLGLIFQVLTSCEAVIERSFSKRETVSIGTPVSQDETGMGYVDAGSGRTLATRFLLDSK